MIHRETIHIMSSQGMPTFHDITGECRAIVGRSAIRDGIVSVYSHHTTCSVITQEPAFDQSMTGLETLQQDFLDMFEKFAPTQRREGMYLHPGPLAVEFAAEHDENLRSAHNTDAHLRSALIGRSESVALIDGQLDLGQFALIYFVDFDQTRARDRTVVVTVIGE